MESVKADNERELTSTMGNVLSMSSKDEKNDTSDATPTSSTDANTTPTASLIVSDDPISSTSSDITEQNKSKTSEANMQNSLEVDDTTVDEPDKCPSVDPEADLLEMSISNVSNEKITEDVEDLVHDLESLLGESTDSFNIPIKRKEDRSPTESEDRKSLGDKEDIDSIDQSEAEKLPDEKGDANSVDQREVNQPQTTSEGIQEIISSDETNPEADKDTEIKTDEIIPDENIISTQTDVQEVEENSDRQTSETNIDGTSKVNNKEPNDLNAENEKEINAPVNDSCSLSDKNQDKSFNSEVPEAPQVTVECSFMSEEKSDSLHKENEESAEDVGENAGDSSIKEPIESVVESKDGAKVEEEHDEDPNKEIDKEIVEKSEAENVEPAEKYGQNEFEDIKIKENPQDSKDSEVSSVVEDIPADDHEAQNNQLQVAVEGITNVSGSDDHEEQKSELQSTVEGITSVSDEDADVRTEPTVTIEAQSCDKVLSAIKESLQDNEQSKEEEEKEAIVESSEDESTSDIIELKEIDARDIDKEKDAHIGIKRDLYEAFLFDNESETTEQSETQDEVIEVDPIISDTDQCKEGCEQVDGTVTENEENKLQPEMALNKDMAEREADGDPKPEEIPSQSDVQDIAEPITEDGGKELNEVVEELAEEKVLDDATIVTESESQVNIPESTVDNVARYAESKIEDIVSPILPLVPPEEVIEDAQCPVSPNTDKTTDIQPIDETVTSSPTDIENDELPREVETSESLVTQNITPEVSTDVESSVPIENQELVGVISKSEQVEDDTTEAIESTVENIHTVSESTMDISEENGQVQSPKSPSESTERREIGESEETKAECIESIDAFADDSTEIGQSESKEIIQPVTSSEVSKAVLIQSETSEVEKVDETEAQSLEENIDERHEESAMETEAVEVTTDILAEEVAASTTENESSNMQTEALDEVVSPNPKFDPTNETSESNNEHLELIHETRVSSSESHETNEAASTNVKAPLPELEKEPCITINDISNSADESSMAGENISESNEETANPVEETTKADEDVSEPVEDSSEPGDISNLEKEPPHEITTGELPETESNIENVQEQIIADSSKPETDENIEPPGDLMNESDGEKSSSEEMIAEPSQEDKEASDKVVEISDEDSKATSEEPESIQVLSSSADSDSEEVVPVLALEPDEDVPSPKEPIAGRDDTEIEDSSVEVHPSDTAAVTEPLPEIEDSLTDQVRIDEAVVESSIDMQDNLETILAVASLQNIENTQVVVETCVEPEMSEKERREMEALRKAVESITENTTDDFEDDDDVELITEVAIPEEDTAMEPETIDTSESLLQVVATELIGDKVEAVVEIDKTVSTLTIVDSGGDNSDEDVVELKIEESVETVQVEEDSAEESTVESKIGNEADENLQALPDTSEDKVVESETKQPETGDVLPDSSQSITLNEEARQSEASRDKEARTKSNERPRRHKKSSTDNKLEELSINVDVPDKDKSYSPKVTIKPIKVPDEEVSTTSNSDSDIGKGSLKMTITKQSDKMHSILKICDPESSEACQEQEEPIPKLIIKPKMQHIEQQHSPKMSTRSSRQVYSPTSSTQRSGSPRITIKPVVKPEKVESVSPLKIKIKPDDTPKKHNLKVNIKPVTKPDEEVSRETVHSPRKVIIKPVVKPVEEIEQVHSPRITIKPIPKPEVERESTPATPRLNIKPIKKQEEDDCEVDKERSSPKITIKPVVKPQEPDTQSTEGDDEVKERIVLKINKGNLPTPTKDSKKREHPPDDDKSEKLAKITVKFSKGGGHPHIVQQSEESNKRAQEEQSSPEKVKKQKTEPESPISTRSKHKEAVTEAPVETRSKHKEVPAENPSGDSARTKQKETEPAHESPRTKHKDPMTESPIEPKRAKLKDTAPEMPVHESMRSSRHKESIGDVQVCEATRSKPNAPEKLDSSNENDDVKIIEAKLDSPIVISEDSRSQDSGSCVIVDELKDPLSAIPVFEITAESAKIMLAKSESAKATAAKSESVSSTPSTPPTPTPRKRGRPRKVPIVVREDFKEQEETPKSEAPKEDAPPAAPESGRPKRSCRGQSARATLGIKPRKPRGPGRGRGSKRGMGTRSVPMKPEGLSK